MLTRVHLIVFCVGFSFGQTIDITCEYSTKLVNCAAPGEIVSATVKSQKSACQYGFSYGFKGSSIWVDKGCKAVFTVQYKAKPAGGQAVCYVTNSDVWIRSTPNVSGSPIRTIPQGASVTRVSMREVTADGHTWYNIQYADSSQGSSAGSLIAQSAPAIRKEKPSPNFEKRPPFITAIIIHATANSALQETIDWFNNADSGASAHYTVGKDGTIAQHVKDEKRSWHAGVSTFKGRSDVNDYSIGIEIVNRNDGKDPYPQVQQDAVATLVAALMAKYGLDISDIATHEAIALPKGRKTDPKGYPVDSLKAAVTQKLQASSTNMPSSNFVGALYQSERPPFITAIVVHATVTNDLQSVIDHFSKKESEVSAHYTIDRDGTIVQQVSDADRAYHAGESIWKGRKAVNAYSIGIELVNLNNGKDPYPQAQQNALVNLVSYLAYKYGVDVSDITTHRDVGIPYGRKSDPVGYDMDKLRRDVRSKLYGSQGGPAVPAEGWSAATFLTQKSC